MGSATPRFLPRFDTRTVADFAEYMSRAGRYGLYAIGEAPSERDKQQLHLGGKHRLRFSDHQFSTEKLAESIVTGWENSPEHRENILMPGVAHAGGAIVQSEKTDV